MTDDFAVLVLSCDKYSDLWPSFFRCFRKNFTMKYPKIYLGSNTISCVEPGVITVLSGEDQDWSTSFRKILQQISEKKLFIVLEDLFFASLVEQKLYEDVVNFLFLTDAKYIRYWPGVGFDEPSSSPDLFCIARGAPYRATVCGFWDRTYLLSLLLDGESPWNFEILGSYRTSYTDGFYALSRPLFQYKNLVEKGCWIPDSVQWAKSNRVELNIEKRPMLVGGRKFVSQLQMFYFQLVLHVSWRKRVKVMDMLRKLIISY